MTVWTISSPSRDEDWVHWWLRCFPMTRASLAKRFLESAISMGESWLSILPLGPSTRATGTSCQAVCTAAREGLEEARNLPDCAPYFFPIPTLSARHRPEAPGNYPHCSIPPPFSSPNTPPPPPTPHSM